uniref:Acyl-CoA:lysophosphatidylglycerol acyltransferase 1 n=1 Tax=Hirondellea gigas TaxID=1518452 RepID=A0A6A7G6H3_9CRUS
MMDGGNHGLTQTMIYIKKCEAFLFGLVRIVFVFINNMYCVPVHMFWLLLLQPLRLVLPDAYWKIEGIFFRWLLSMVAMWSYSAGYDVIELGDDVWQLANERVVVMYNHQSTSDVPLIMAAFNCQPFFSSSVMWIMDSIFKLTNFGVVSITHGDFFIRAGKSCRESSLMALRNHLRNFYQPMARKWIVLFPEGGFLSNRKISSQKFGKKLGLPHLENVSLPRSGALKAILDHSAEQTTDGIKWVVDVTVGYPGGDPLDLQTLVFGWRPPCCTVMHYRCYTANKIPRDEAGLNAWLYERYVEKERMLAEYYMTGVFPDGPSPAFPTPLPLPSLQQESAAGSTENSGSSTQQAQQKTLSETTLLLQNVALTPTTAANINSVDGKILMGQQQEKHVDTTLILKTTSEKSGCVTNGNSSERVGAVGSNTECCSSQQVSSEKKLSCADFEGGEYNLDKVFSGKENAQSQPCALLNCDQAVLKQSFDNEDDGHGQLSGGARVDALFDGAEDTAIIASSKSNISVSCSCTSNNRSNNTTNISSSSNVQELNHVNLSRSKDCSQASLQPRTTPNTYNFIFVNDDSSSNSNCVPDTVNNNSPKHSLLMHSQENSNSGNIDSKMSDTYSAQAGPSVSKAATMESGTNTCNSASVATITSNYNMSCGSNTAVVAPLYPETERPDLPKLPGTKLQHDPLESVLRHMFYIVSSYLACTALSYACSSVLHLCC